MWKRAGQSSALDRAQALLFDKKRSGVVGQSTRGSPAKTQGSVDGSIKTKPVLPNTHTLLSDVSDLSSLSSAPEHRAYTIGSSDPKKNPDGNRNSKDLRPQSSLGGGGSRFLKKAPPPITNSSRSPVSKNHIQLMPEPRYVSSSQRGSQTAVLSKLAQIESRFRSHNQSQEQDKEGPQVAPNRTTKRGVSQPLEAVTQSLETSTLPVSVHSSSDQSLKGKNFLKKKAAVTIDDTNISASGSLNGPHAGVRSWPRVAGVPLGGLETKSVKVAHDVSLESDEEDMRKLLGDSLNSTDKSFLKSENISFIKKTDKISSQNAYSTPSPPAVQPLSSNSAPPRSPTSPSHHSSPFRFTGQAQARFSPSALSPSPSPPCVSPSLSGKLNSPRRKDSPQQSVSTMSHHSEVLSLEELFPVQPASDHLYSERSIVSSEDFKLNLMTLDDLVPATLGFTEETPGKQREENNSPVSEYLCEGLATYKEVEQQQQQEEEEDEDDVLDYQSDFESESRTKQNYSSSQVPEQLLGDGYRDEEGAVSEVREEESDSDVSHGRTEDDYSSTFSNPSRTEHSDISRSFSRSGDSRSRGSHSTQTSSHQVDRPAAARRLLKEAAVQTQPEAMAHKRSTGMTTPGPSLGLTSMNPTSVAVHTLSAETVQALSTYNPGVFILNEMLKQQLATTRQFIESSRHFHSNLVQSLEPPNYRYTTLEDTKEYIRMHRPPKLTMEKALKEVIQEKRECHCTM